MYTYWFLQKSFGLICQFFFYFGGNLLLHYILLIFFCGCCLSGGCSFFLLYDSHKFYCLDLVKSKNIFREIYIKSLLNVFFFKLQMVWICFGYRNFLFIFLVTSIFTTHLLWLQIKKNKNRKMIPLKNFVVFLASCWELFVWLFQNNGRAFMLNLKFIIIFVKKVKPTKSNIICYRYVRAINLHSNIFCFKCYLFFGGIYCLVLIVGYNF